MLTGVLSLKWIASFIRDVPYDAEDRVRSQETGDRRQWEKSIEHREIISNFGFRIANLRGQGEWR